MMMLMMTGSVFAMLACKLPSSAVGARRRADPAHAFVINNLGHENWERLGEAWILRSQKWTGEDFCNETVRDSLIAAFN